MYVGKCSSIESIAGAWKPLDLFSFLPNSTLSSTDRVRNAICHAVNEPAQTFLIMRCAFANKKHRAAKLPCVLVPSLHKLAKRPVTTEPKRHGTSREHVRCVTPALPVTSCLCAREKPCTLHCMTNSRRCAVF